MGAVICQNVATAQVYRRTAAAPPPPPPAAAAAGDSGFVDQCSAATRCHRRTAPAAAGAVAAGDGGVVGQHAAAAQAHPRAAGAAGAGEDADGGVAANDGAAIGQGTVGAQGHRRAAGAADKKAGNACTAGYGGTGLHLQPGGVVDGDRRVCAIVEDERARVDRGRAVGCRAVERERTRAQF